MSVTINLSMSLQYHILHMLKKKKKRGLLGPEFVTQQVWGGGGRGPRMCICYRFPGAVAAASLGATF